MEAIIKKNIIKRLTPNQIEQFREFRKECNLKMLQYQIERYSNKEHKLYEFFKTKTNDWTSPFWSLSGEEIILSVSNNTGIGWVEVLLCPSLGLSKCITEYSNW